MTELEDGPTATVEALRKVLSPARPSAKRTVKASERVDEDMKLDGVKRRYTGGGRGWIGDNKLVELSLEKMKKLGWEPKVSPGEAIRATARWTLANS